jgi:UDP-GlcNAc:undecaprenyl-phosphate GlcNAc-1-phosphate transferase
VTSFWFSLGASVLLTGLSVPVLRRARFLDVPNQRSSHAVVTPRGGGVAVMIAVVAGVVSSGDIATWPLIVLAIILAVVGLVDDARSLSSRTRLGAQLLIGVALCSWVAMYVGTSGFAGVMFGVVSVLGVVSYVNAFNFMDGINGIAALNAALAGTWFAWLGREYDIPVVMLVGGTLAGAALGFFPWNSPRARVFLGDVGSYGIGAVIAGLAVFSWGAGAPGTWATAPLLVYLADTGWVILRRARAGASLMEAHREHVYQRLVGQGWGHFPTACANVAAGILVCLVMVIATPSHPEATAALTLAVLVLYLSLPKLDRRLRAAATRATR